MTNNANAQFSPSKDQVEAELKKAIDAQSKQDEEQEEKKQLMYDVELVKQKNNTDDISPQGKKEILDEAGKYMENVFVGVFPGLTNYSDDEYFESKQRKNATGKYNIDVTPGDVNAARIYLNKLETVPFNKAKAIDSTLKSNTMLIDLLNVGFSVIKTPDIYITYEDIQSLFDNQIKETQNVTKLAGKELPKKAYYKSAIYGLLIEVAYISFSLYQDILRTEIETNNKTLSKIEYPIKDKSIVIDINNIKLKAYNALKLIQLYIERDKREQLFSENEKTFDKIHESLRYYFVYNNMLKTELFIYNNANLWNCITKSPLIEESLKISQHTYSKKNLLLQFVNAIKDINAIFETKKLSDRQERLRNIILKNKNILSKIKIFTIKSLLNLVHKDFSGKGLFTKEYRYTTLYTYFNNTIKKYSDMLLKKNSIDIDKLLEKSNIDFEVNLYEKKIKTKIQLKEEAINNPFFRYMTDFSLEIITYADKDFKHVEINIGKTENNKFNGIKVLKYSSMLKQGFNIGFDTKDRSGYTQILKIKNDIPIEAEFKYFESLNNITYSRELLLVPDKDNTSYIDVEGKTIIGQGNATMLTIDYATNKASKKKWVINTKKDKKLAA